MKKSFGMVLLCFFLAGNLFSENFGLVLSGGGAKGAYEVGVWKALEEYGITDDISVISGSSVGALNGALFACVAPNQVEKLWREEVGYSSFLMPDSSSISEVAAYAVRSAENNLGKKAQEEDPYGLGNRLSEADSEFVRYLLDGVTFIADTSLGLARGTLRYIVNYIFGETHSDGLFTRDALREMMNQYVSLEKIKKSGKTVYASSIRKDGLLLVNAMLKLFGTDSVHYFQLNEQINSDNIYSILMASSSFPIVYESTLLSEDVVEDGYKAGAFYEYIDGGFESVGGKNTPIYPVAKQEDVDTIFVVYLKSQSELDDTIGARLREEEFNGKKGIEIIPSRDLGDFIDGTLNFDPETVNDLIDLGYSDTCLQLEQNGYKKTNKMKRFFSHMF